MNTRQLHKMSVNNAAVPCQLVELGISFAYEKEPRPETARRGMASAWWGRFSIFISPKRFSYHTGASQLIVRILPRLGVYGSQGWAVYHRPIPAGFS